MLNQTPAARQLENEETRKKILARIGVITKMEPGVLTGPERLEDLNDWDSLAVLDFLLEAETQFSAEIQSESLEKCQTVEDLVNVVVGATLRKAS